MLLIRPEQYAVLEADAERAFENDLVLHLQAFAARHCEIIGESGVRQVIHLGRDSCRRYSLVHRGPIRFFIDLMFMFGSRFDTDVQHPWVGDEMNNLVLSDMFRANALYQRATQYLEAVSGPDNILAKTALRATRRLASEASFTSGSNLESQLVDHLSTVYPAKCSWLGSERLVVVFRGGITVAEQHGVTTPNGRGLFGVLAFALGHRFADDPLYPWVATTLRNGSRDPDERAERLREKALLYLDRTLVHLGLV